MRHIILLFVLILSSQHSSACEEKSWDSVARKYLEKDSPKGSQIEIQKEGKQFNFSIRHKIANGQYSKNGTLSVQADSEGPCAVKVISSQIQTQGGYELPKTSEAVSSGPIDLKKLSGTWSSGCMQMQDGKNQGYVTEAYSFDQNKISLKRSWFKAQNCQGKAFLSQSEKGTFDVGRENTNNGFNPSGTHEVIYSIGQGSELGLLWVNDTFSELRLSRGFGSSQNTMLSLTIFKKAD